MPGGIEDGARERRGLPARARRDGALQARARAAIAQRERKGPASGVGRREPAGVDAAAVVDRERLAGRVARIERAGAAVGGHAVGVGVEAARRQRPGALDDLDRADAGSPLAAAARPRPLRARDVAALVRVDLAARDLLARGRASATRGGFGAGPAPAAPAGARILARAAAQVRRGSRDFRKPRRDHAYASDDERHPRQPETSSSGRMVGIRRARRLGATDVPPRSVSHGTPEPARSHPIPGTSTVRSPARRPASDRKKVRGSQHLRTFGPLTRMLPPCRTVPTALTVPITSSPGSRKSASFPPPKAFSERARARLPRRLRVDAPAVARGARGVLARAHGRSRCGARRGRSSRSGRCPRAKFFVGAQPQHHRELPRPAPGHAAPDQGGAHLGGRAGRHPHADVLRASPSRRASCGCADRPGRPRGRPRRHLHGHGARGRRRDARLRAPGRSSLRRLRRLQLGGAARSHQRLRGEGAAHAGRGVAQGQRRAAQEDGRRRRSSRRRAIEKVVVLERIGPRRARPSS